MLNRYDYDSIQAGRELLSTNTLLKLRDSLLIAQKKFNVCFTSQS